MPHNIRRGATAMKRFLFVGFGLAVLGLSYAAAEDKPSPAPRERVELAKKIYQARILHGLERRMDPPTVPPSGPRTDPLLNEDMAEELHRWSVRWMEAEQDSATNRAGRIAATQAHLDRMISIESGTMVHKELADHPLVKEMDERKTPVDFPLELLVKELKNGNEYSEAMRRYPEVVRYFRLEAEALLAKEKAGR
jgi:hypothetical protein